MDERMQFVARRRGDGGTLQRVRHRSQNRVQDFRAKPAVRWLRLGIGIERIQPGHPQQNGRHERMHLTLKKEATKPAAANFLQQQARFDTSCRRRTSNRKTVLSDIQSRYFNRAFRRLSVKEFQYSQDYQHKQRHKQQ
jgi:transposase InsO family protein